MLSVRREHCQSLVVSQLDVEAALRRHVARYNRRYNLKLRHYPIIPRLGSAGD